MYDLVVESGGFYSGSDEWFCPLGWDTVSPDTGVATSAGVWDGPVGQVPILQHKWYKTSLEMWG